MAKSTKKSTDCTDALVEVALTVTRFRKVLHSTGLGAGRGTGYVMTLLQPNDLVRIKDNVIYVKAPGAAIRFILGAAAGAKENYFPNGITFLRRSKRNENDEQRLGLLNFPQADTRVAGRTLVVNYRTLDDPLKLRYKFSVVVQRGSDGAIGIIDPDIEHDNSDQN